jgi:deoxyadenosine/deoxycytidine kinase
MSEKRRIIAVAGTIGAGKSSLVEWLEKKFGMVPFFEPNDENPYLADFYGDMPRWALPAQLRFLVGRVAMTKEAIAAGRSAICDRTCYEDAEIFAANLHGRGAMDGRDWETYRLVAKEVLSGLPTPDLLVYLRRSPESCRAQIARRGREYEESIPDDYLRDLHARYDAWFETYRGTKIVVTAEQHDFLGSDVDLDALVRRIAESMPQPLLPFALGAT